MCFEPDPDFDSWFRSRWEDAIQRCKFIWFNDTQGYKILKEEERKRVKEKYKEITGKELDLEKMSFEDGIVFCHVMSRERCFRIANPGYEGLEDWGEVKK